METQLLQSKNIRYIDQSKTSLSLPAYHAFAIDDSLCTSISDDIDVAIVRTWVHTPTVVLGLQDTRLPYLEKGLPFLVKSGYNPVVRNSGGLAVVLDEEILNITLLLHDIKKSISIEKAYEEMVTLIKAMFSSFTDKIEAKEITRSYCPGSFDLSIDNKKFAGISQRRVKHGIAIQIYLCVSSDGEARAALIKQFYDLALNGESTKVNYPDIDPSCMASLSDLLGVSLSIDDVLLLLQKELERNSTNMVVDTLTTKEITVYHQKLPILAERNKDILEDYFHE